MTDEPKPPARKRRARPLRVGDDTPPKTIADLNAKLDRIIDNGVQQFAAVRALAQTNATKNRSYRRLLWAVAVLAVAAFGLGVVAVQASSDAKAAKGQLCEAARTNRAVLRNVVVASYAQPGVGDLRELAAYPRLDPATKAWVDDLQAAIMPIPPAVNWDANDNGVPDAIDRILDEPVCTDVAAGSRRGVAVILVVVAGAGSGFVVYERRRRRQDEPVS